MSQIIDYNEIKRALGLPAGARLARVEKELIEKGLPYHYGHNCLFATVDAWNAKIMGLEIGKQTDKIELL